MSPLSVNQNEIILDLKKKKVNITKKIVLFAVTAFGVYYLIYLINPIQGGGQKRLRFTFSSNYCRKAAINDYFNSL